MKKVLTLLLVTMISFALLACQEETTEAPREVKTYVDWTFNSLELNAEIPNTASEGCGFKVLAVEDGENWIGSAGADTWGAMYFGTPDENGEEVFLKDFAVTTVMRLPAENDGIENDGGIPILVGAAGRYDVAVGFKGGESVVNIWHAGNTANGPMATSGDPEAGGKVSSLTLNVDTEYTLTVLGRYEGMTDEGDEYMTLYVFIDDLLVIEISGLAYWQGGFGLRGWQSAIQYKNILVTDFPLIAPDGNNYY